MILKWGKEKTGGGIGEVIGQGQEVEKQRLEPCSQKLLND